VGVADIDRAAGRAQLVRRLRLRHPGLRGSFFRFLLVGAANTLVTGLLMIAISEWVEIEVAYTIVFILGLTFTTIVAGPFVFRSRLTSQAIRRFVSWYLCVYLAGVTVAHLAGSQLHVSHVVATVAVLAVTAPLNFLGGSRAFAPQAGGPRV
jgi:putative flippase GtrA